MSWHFLQELEEASWQDACLDGAPSALLKLIRIADVYYSQDNAMESYPDSRSGMMSAHSTANHGGGESMSSAADFRAKTSASQDEARESTEQSLGCGWKWPGSFAKWDPVLCLWKTRQRSLVAGLDVFSETWPRLGIMQNGECSELKQPELRTKNANESGLWPTPLAIGDRKSKFAQGGTPLGYAVRYWPTPTVTGNHNRKGASKNSGDGLATAVKWATPTCHDRKGKSGAKRGQNAQGSECLTEQAGGTLNPPWVEWLMGWPVGWTDCEPLGMDKFRQWLRSHGKR